MASVTEKAVVLSRIKEHFLVYSTALLESTSTAQQLLKGMVMTIYFRYRTISSYVQILDFQFLFIIQNQAQACNIFFSSLQRH